MRSITLATVLIASAQPAAAHGFGQRYDLPLPLSLYLFATAAAVVLSFIIVAMFARHAPGACFYPKTALPISPVARRLISGPCKLLTVGLLLFVIAAGFLGSRDPYRNIAPTLVWIVWWVGLAVFSAFVGDLWALVNPWRTLFDAADRVYRRVTGRAGLSLGVAYPDALGAWPAVALLLAVSWTELVSPSPAAPLNIAWLALAYSLLTWAGMLLFGSAVWLARGEVFAVFFGLFARFAPTELTTGASDRGSAGGLALRPFGAGLLAAQPAPPSMVAFILLVLASVLYDGLLTTPAWADIEALLSPSSGPMTVRTIGLIGFWGAFLGAYLAISGLMSAIARDSTWRQIAAGFAFTLVPIAIAYHLAHYLTYLLTQGQYLVPLLSDPFGRGWNLFGTAGYRVDIAVVGARFAWYEAVAAIVVGHVIAVYLADVRAHQLFASRAAALRSQLPLTALMVAYTFVSLSILAEPIVERRAPAAPSVVAEPVAIPPDALLPQAATGDLRPVGPGQAARVKLTYRMLGSAFHDGTPMSDADILYAYSFAYRWGARGADEARYDPAIDAATAGLRQRLKAVRLAGVDAASKSFRVGDVQFTRELFIVDVYADLPPSEPERQAVFLPPWSTLPWHVLALMEEAVSRGWAAFSQPEAERRGVPWLDVARDEALKTRLAGLVDRFGEQGFRPAALQSRVDPAEATRRWTALAAFYREHHHFLVTNGPYRLKSWSADRATLEAFRDLSYPLGVGSYDVYAMPRRGYVTNSERVAGGLRLTADIETVQKFMRDYQIVRQPMTALDSASFQRAAAECRYAVLDGDGRVALAGTIAPQQDRAFLIDLDGRLPPGPYTVMAAIIVNGNATNPAIERIPVTIGR